MMQAGRVSMGAGDIEGLTSPWMFTFHVPSGVYDLVASDGYRDVVDSTRRIAIRRDMKATTSLSISSAVDLLKEGTQLEESAVAVEGVEAGDRILSRVELSTSAGGFFTVSELDGMVAATVPQSLLQSGESQYISFSATYPPFSRSVLTQAISSKLTLPPRLSSIVFEGRTASWTELPPYSTVSLYASDANHRVSVVASSEWLAAHPMKSLGLDEGLPWFRDDWRFSPTYLALTALLDDGTEKSLTSYTEVRTNP
jgi:hypothetical protein